MSPDCVIKTVQCDETFLKSLRKHEFRKQKNKHLARDIIDFLTKNKFSLETSRNSTFKTHVSLETSCVPSIKTCISLEMSSDLSIKIGLPLETFENSARGRL